MNAGPISTVRTTCPYCGVGCGVIARTDGRQLLAVSGDDAHPANRGRLCVKGSTLPDTQLPDGRLRHPMVEGRRTTWAAALDRVASGFRDTIAEHGPGSVAFYLSGQLLTEDYYVANKLMKGFLGSANVDTNSRLCMASAVAAHKRAFGEDVVACNYDDLERCELVVFVGSNAAWTHPVLYQRLAARKAASGLRVVVIDPRRTATCELADLHLTIRPGMDAALFNALLVHLVDHGAIDRDFVGSHTEGFSAALASARSDAFDVIARTGLDAEALRTFFDWFADTDRVVTFFSQGVNQAANGTDKANSIINAHLATGRIGRPGMGPFSITGQPNAMGGREVGGMANQLAAHRDFDPDSISRVGRFWRATAMANSAGLKAVDLFRAVADGSVRAIWIMGTNPAVSLPRAAEAGQALDRCPLVVVSDCVAETETTRHADVLLPAQAWGEKDGTVTNSERCISRQRGFLLPLGEARPDWWMICEVARRLGFAEAFAYGSPAAIFREHAALSGLDSQAPQRFRIGELARLTDAEYDRLEPFQWAEQPFRGGRFPTPDGRARFVPVAPAVPVQQRRDGYDLVLNTGRLRDQWHTMTRTGLAPRLFGHVDVPLLAMHPDDAATRGFNAGALVEVRNPAGRIRAILEITDAVAPGTLYFPIHWNGRFADPCRVNDLVASVTDPVSGQPESKHAIARVRALAAGSWVRWVGAGGTLMGDGLFAIHLPGPAGDRHEVALESMPVGLPAFTPSSVAGANIMRLVGPGGARWLIEREGTVVSAGAVAGSRAGLPTWATLESALAPGVAADWRLLGDAAQTPPARLVCTCFEVREDAITDAIGHGCRDTDALGLRLLCGTNCGSCVPELNALIRAVGVLPRALTG